MSYDPDGDRVRCRYGNIPYLECINCNLPQGFHLDQDSCTLHYRGATADPRVFAFEMVVEDYPRGHIDLSYSDGSRRHKHPLLSRRKRWSPWWYYQSTTPPPQAPTTGSWHWWWPTATSPETTTPPTTTTSWHRGWWPSTTSPETTTTSSSTAPPTTTTTPPWHWWWPSTSSPTTTTTYPPTTTTTYPPTTTTTYPPTTTTTYPPTTTTTYPPTTTTTYPPTTTTSPTPSSSAPYVNSPPLSKLPLQFSLLVDPDAPSCQEGVYLPRFVSPTPENGEHIQAEVNKETEIRIKAVATHSVLQNIIISGPTNVSKSRNTHDEFVIRWTPTVDDLGDHYPVCFAVESSTGSGIYQSEMRCVVLDIRKKQIEARVTCGDASMTVEVEKSSFSGIQARQLRLSDASNTACNLAARSNSTHIIATVPLNSCGTQIEEDDDYIIFKNEISTGEDVGQLVTRHHLLEARFYCRYPRRGNASLGFTAHRRNVTVWEKGLGTFTYQLEFYRDPAFRSLIRPDSYPLEYELGSRIYLQLDASSSLNSTVMMVDSCRAAPYDNPSYRPSYSIIQNGCAVDPTVQTYSPPDQNQFQFSMEAFKFIGMHDQVYISCSVIMCEAGNPNTRCSQGCLNASWPQAHRHRREAPIESDAHFVSQGPLRLKRSAEAYGAPGLNMNLVLVAGCLLAAVAMICGVIVFKARMSKVRYQPLPSSED
ncbi:CUB and zona pellucida-like domain-containing protein 1 isoform X2 [Cololabis saira]|uniref:CUB and zona pellucida-like domain-containing protein 1 isoform X2 n=1 Tax=Cololabis saira TaxID=129043 RepID=UPI002AD58159|nr:CUB and zona pellucida-like domain-containing protein 1 isoform X2 [Cololabis saira]